MYGLIREHIEKFDAFAVHYFLQKKLTKNNTIFQTRYHNFHILQFTEIGLHLSESQINCASSDVQHFDL